MKKALSLLLVLVLLLSLCACGKDDAQSTDPGTTPGQGTTDNTEAPTDGTTEGTQAPAEASTTAPTDEPTTAPTETPTTKPTEAPAAKPTGTSTTPSTKPAATCSHSWKAATCTAPKTCSKCGATTGSALGHNYQNGTCTGCGAAEAVTHPFGTDTGYAASLSSDGKKLNCYQLDSDLLLYKTYYTEKPAEGAYQIRTYNGTTYYSADAGISWGWYSVSSHTISGRTVQLDLDVETLELKLISANQYKITKGVKYIPEGLVVTFGTDPCSQMGHWSFVKCEGDITCDDCGQFLCKGFGHEYGEDGVCFRCFSAMRPGN